MTGVRGVEKKRRNHRIMTKTTKNLVNSGVDYSTTNNNSSTGLADTNNNRHPSRSMGNIIPPPLNTSSLPLGLIPPTARFDTQQQLQLQQQQHQHQHQLHIYQQQQQQPVMSGPPQHVFFPIFSSPLPQQQNAPSFAYASSSASTHQQHQISPYGGSPTLHHFPFPPQHPQHPQQPPPPPPPNGYSLYTYPTPPPPPPPLSTAVGTAHARVASSSSSSPPTATRPSKALPMSSFSPSGSRVAVGGGGGGGGGGNKAMDMAAAAAISKTAMGRSPNDNDSVGTADSFMYTHETRPLLMTSDEIEYQFMHGTTEGQKYTHPPPHYHYGSVGNSLNNTKSNVTSPQSQNESGTDQVSTTPTPRSNSLPASSRVDNKNSSIVRSVSFSSLLPDKPLNLPPKPKPTHQHQHPHYHHHQHHRRAASDQMASSAGGVVPAADTQFTSHLYRKQVSHPLRDTDASSRRLYGTTTFPPPRLQSPSSVQSIQRHHHHRHHHHHRRSGSRSSAQSFDFSATSMASHVSFRSDIAKSDLFRGVTDSGHVQLTLPYEAVRIVVDPDLEVGHLYVHTIDPESYERYHVAAEDVNISSWERLDDDVPLADQRKHQQQKLGNVQHMHPLGGECICTCFNCRHCTISSRKLGGVLPSTQYVLPIPDDIYRRVVDEISTSYRMPCGLFFCGQHEDVNHPSIALAVAIVATVFIGMAYVAFWM
jgi:hypothetical protein